MLACVCLFSLDLGGRACFEHAPPGPGWCALRNKCQHLRNVHCDPYLLSYAYCFPVRKKDGAPCVRTRGQGPCKKIRGATCIISEVGACERPKKFGDRLC